MQETCTILAVISGIITLVILVALAVQSMKDA